METQDALAKIMSKQSYNIKLSKEQIAFEISQTLNKN